MRIMLDTNLWSYLGDEGTARDFDREMAARRITVVVPPSTLVEIMRLPRSDVRQRIIDAVGKGPRTRLRTEADCESMELVEEIRRTRPDWLRQIPDAAKVASLRSWWTNRFWREALDDSQRMHEYETSGWLKAQRDYLIRHQRAARRDLLRSDLTMRPLSAITGVPVFSDGESVFEDAAIAGSPAMSEVIAGRLRPGPRRRSAAPSTSASRHSRSRTGLRAPLSPASGAF